MQAHAHRSLCAAHAPAVPCVETLAPGVAGEALALAGEALGRIELDVRTVPDAGGLAHLLGQLSHYSGHLDLRMLWRWVLGVGGPAALEGLLKSHIPVARHLHLANGT
jgi:hypothetical protein